MAKVTPEVLEKTLTKYNAVIQQEFDAVEKSIEDHAQDTDIHVTAEEKAKLQSVTNIVFFTPDTHYGKDTMLLHKGDTDTNYSMYICTIEHTSGATFDEANWEFVIGKQGFLYVSDTQPTKTNVLWVDIADANNPVLKFYNGTAWIELSGTGGTDNVNLDDYVAKTDVMDNLTSDAVDKPLSANQGKVLNESIEKVKGMQKTISWADYQALSEEEKKNGTLYDIPDMPTGGTEEFLRESDIVATLDSTVTNKQIIGALALKEKIDDLVKGIGITQVTDLYPEDIRYFPLGKFRFSSNDIASNFIELPELGKACTLEVSSISSLKTLDQVYCYRFYRVVTCEGAEYTRALNTATNAGVIASDTGWRSVTTISVPDVSKKQLTLTLPNTLTVGRNGIRFQYMVVDGVCEMFIYAHLLANTFTGYSTIGAGMPIPMLGDAGTDILPTDSRNPYLKCAVTNSGELRILIPEQFNGEGAYWTGTLRYKVAED